MNTLILSDLHIGADNSKLHRHNLKAFDGLVDYITGDANADVLVLAGDILDFSLCSSQVTISDARLFFSRLAAHPKCPSQVIYLPGNHDKIMWNLLRDQYTLVFPLTKPSYKPWDSFPHSIPVKMDVAAGKPELYYFEESSYRVPSQSIYGKDGLMAGLYGLPAESIKNSTYLAYPNLYLESKNGLILVTHGHFFQIPFALVSLLWSNLIMEKRDGNPADFPNFLTVGELEAVNSPLTIMVWASMGQVAPIRKIMDIVYAEVADGQSTDMIDTLLDQAFQSLDNNCFHFEETGNPHLIQEKKNDLMLFAIKEALKFAASKLLKHGSNSRVPDLFTEYVNRYLTDQFLEASVEHYRRTAGLPQKPQFNHVILGHTHYPFGYMDKPDGWQPDVAFHNCGGWLTEPGCEPMAFIVNENGDISSRLLDDI